MEASLTNPVYTVVIAAKDGTKYTVKDGNTNVVTSLMLSENEQQLAQTVQITMVNVQTEDGSYLSEHLALMQRIFIYADTGDKREEVFRGFLWDRHYSSQVEKELTFTCYDNLIYFQESEDSRFYTADKTTKEICEDICSGWGVSLEYNYDTIKHPKLPLRGNLADIFLEDILAKVKKQTGKKFVMRSIQDVIHIDYTGANDTVYQINKEENAISVVSKETMNGMVTKVIVTGKEDKDQRLPVEATLSGNTADYGTLQKVFSCLDSKKLEEVKKEAQTLLDEQGKPKKTFELEVVDIPWIRKGDKIQVAAGDMINSYIVLGVTHDITNRTMSIDCELAENDKQGG